MPSVPNVTTKEEAAAKIALIRKLIEKGVKNREIANRTGYTVAGIQHIRSGRNRAPRHRHYGTPKPDALDLGKLLGIVRHSGGVICIRCSERRYLIAKTGLCIECECLTLIRQGVAKTIDAGNG